ncbi:MAG: hypothetical protein FJ033_10920 [Chloroflexi bacterium]|nr:hypothetical protein [Chloroflexota bacterium]
MSRSNLFTQLGVASEATYGTLVAPTRFLEFCSESLSLDIARIEAKGLRTGVRVLRQDHVAAGKRQAAGDVEFEVGNKGFGLLLSSWALGTVATTASGTGKKHSGTVGDLFGDMLTMQVGRPDLAGTVHPFSYLGCKCAEFTLSQQIDDTLRFKASVDARDEDTATALTTATAPGLTEAFHWGELAVTVGGSALELDSFEVTCNNSLKVDRFKLRGDTLKDQPVEAGKREITGKLAVELSTLTDYNRFKSLTFAAIVATWTKVTTYDVGLPYKMVVTIPAARFDGATPNVGDDGINMIELPFKAHDDGTNSPITIDYYTADASP